MCVCVCVCVCLCVHVHQFEQKKSYKDQLKARDKAIEEERRRVTQAKLKKFDEEAIRRRMHYKGIPVTASSGILVACVQSHLGHRSIIDYIITDKALMQASSNVFVDRTDVRPSDHYLVWFELERTFGRNRKKQSAFCINGE